MTTTPQPDRNSSPKADSSGLDSKTGPIPADAFDDADPAPGDGALAFLKPEDKEFYEKMVADRLAEKVTSS